MIVSVEKISDTSTLEKAFEIRKEVFVIEQAVDEAEEYEFEEESQHFIAKIENQYAGTARWRKTNNGIKLERFAVRKEFRSKGVGAALLSFILKDIPSENKYLYLHAQLTAMGLYSKFGFIPEGEQFEEAGIQHYKMILKR